MKDFRKTADECRAFLLEIGRLIKCSFIPVAIFTIGYVMLSTLVIMVAADRFARIGGMLSRVHYISADNIMGLIKEPNGLVFIFIAYWGTVCLISLFQLAGLIHAFSMARAGEKATLSGMIAAGFRGCFKTLNPKNWLIIVPVLVLIPISGIAMIHGAAVYIEMPSFIADVIDQSTLYHLAYIGLYLILVVLVIICIYSFHSYFLEDRSFIAACRESVKLVKGNFWQTLGTILALFFAVSCITISMSSILSSVNTWMTSVIHTSTTEYALLSDTVDAMVGIHIIITATIAPVISVCALTVMYYNRLEAAGSIEKMNFDSLIDRPLRKSVAAVIAVAVIILTAGYIVDNRAMFEMLMQDCTRPEVVAHRGDSARRPENTIPAFELAIAEDTDWIELDVHETKDGEIIVSHDDDLSRVSGKEIFVHDMNYDELKDLDTGSWFSEDYGYIRLTKLEDVLALCKDKVHLQIEIKPTEYDHQLEEKLLKIIYDAGMEKQVTIISLSEKPLKRIKELDPDMRTCYCMALALGRLDMIDFSDDVTVEATRVEEKVVANLHKAGKKCCVWTVNSTEKVQYLVDCGVDMIVTDDPIAIQHALDEAEYSGGLRRILRLYKIRLYTGY